MPKALPATLRPQTELLVGAPGAPHRRMLKPMVVRSRVSSGAGAPSTTGAPPPLPSAMGGGGAASARRRR